MYIGSLAVSERVVFRARRALVRIVAETCVLGSPKEWESLGQYSPAPPTPNSTSRLEAHARTRPPMARRRPGKASSRLFVCAVRNNNSDNNDDGAQPPWKQDVILVVVGKEEGVVVNLRSRRDDSRRRILEKKTFFLLCSPRGIVKLFSQNVTTRQAASWQRRQESSSGLFHWQRAINPLILFPNERLQQH